MSKLLLVDADVIAYRAGFATDKTRYAVTYEDGPKYGVAIYDDAKAAKEAAATVPGSAIWSRKESEPEEQALMLVNLMLKDIQERYPDHEMQLHLTGVGNFRHAIATRANYKGNRAGAVPPTHLKAIRNYLVERGAVTNNGQEADDGLGIAATDNPGSVIVSIDKDLRQIPGTHYNFVEKCEYNVSPKEAWLNFWSQVITGDATDNIPGIAGYGPAKAKKILDGVKGNAACWNRLVDVYTEVYGELLGEDYALECASLVWVRRQPGKNFEPPTSAAAIAA